MIDPPQPVTAPARGRAPDDDALEDPALQLLIALREHIASDRRLRTAAIKVLIYLLPELVDRRHRAVKQVVLAKALRMQQGHVSDCLRVLVKNGHLELGPDDGSRRTYRVSPALLSRLRYRRETLPVDRPA